MKKTIHIVVENGLVQAVYADHGLDVDVVLYDLDTENTAEYAEVTAEVLKLSDRAEMVY